MVVTGYETGSLLIKYLGGPLITSKPKKGDCKPLMDKSLRELNLGGVDSFPMLG